MTEPLQSIRDRFGNSVAFTWDAVNDRGLKLVFTDIIRTDTMSTIGAGAP